MSVRTKSVKWPPWVDEGLKGLLGPSDLKNRNALVVGLARQRAFDFMIGTTLLPIAAVVSKLPAKQRDCVDRFFFQNVTPQRIEKLKKIVAEARAAYALAEAQKVVEQIIHSEIKSSARL